LSESSSKIWSGGAGDGGRSRRLRRTATLALEGATEATDDAEVEALEDGGAAETTVVEAEVGVSAKS